MNKSKILFFLIGLISLFSCKQNEYSQNKKNIVKEKIEKKRKIDSLHLIKDTIVFDESTEGTEIRLLKNLYSNDSIIKVETFGEMGNSNHTFRFNKSLLNIQHIINQYEEPISINSTPKIRSTKTESLKSNNKDELMILFFKYKSVFVKAKQEQILLNPKWVGNYSFTINEENDDWRDTYKGTILIKRNSVIFHVEGYQIDQNYELLFNEDENKLNLTYKKSLDNFVSDVLKNNNDFGIITFDGKEYKWKCPYLDISFADEKKNIYILKKESKKI